MFQEILSKTAPIIGTMIGGPFGAIAGKAISEIGGALLGDENASEEKIAEAMKRATPEQIVKIKQIETNASLEMARIANESKKIDANLDKNEQDNLTKRQKYDMQSDSFLSKNIRPMSLLFTLCSCFIFALLNAFDIKIQDSIITLFQTFGIVQLGFYFGGRTWEKITSIKQGKNK